MDNNSSSDDDDSSRVKKSKKDKKEKKEKKEKKDKKDKKEKKEKKDTVKDDQQNVSDSKKRKLERSEEAVTPEYQRRRTRSMSEVEDRNSIMVTALSQSGEEFRKTHQISVTGFELGDSSAKYRCPEPMVTFTATPFAAPIRAAFTSAGFSSPTPTQAQSWPIALAGRDVITVAKTGSGKTCGFLLPAFHRLLNSSSDRRRGPPGILVLAPTRELACQIEEEAVKFGRTSNIRSTCAYGGSPKSIQIRKLQAGVEVLIATPGRLNDLLEMKMVNLSQVLFLVLDEADRMLDMGFEPQIRTIIAKIPVERQTMFFTATWPREVQTLAREFLRNSIEIKFGDTNNLNANKAILQKILVVSEGDKSDTLKKVLQEVNPSGEPSAVPKCIVFVSRKYSCDDLANSLWNAGYSVDSLHGDKQQFQRTKVMDQFKRGDLKILVATDVAARGLDVKDIEVVINYDFPAGQSGVEDYVHRIGRTARAGREGKAFTFFTATDAKRASELIGVLRRANQEVPDELLKYDRGSQRGGGGGWGGRGGGGGRGRGGFGGGFGGGGRGRGGFGGARKW